MSYQTEKLCASPKQTFYRRYYDEKERKRIDTKMWEKKMIKGSMIHERNTQQKIYFNIRNRLPCNHLLLFIGRMSTTAQNFCRC